MSYNYQAPPASYFSTTMEENDDLRWAIENDPHTVTFWSAVCAFINHEREHGEDPDRVLECPSWGQWRSIGQHLAAGKKVEAVRLLRASTHAWTQDQPALPPYITNEGWRAFMAANALPAWDRRGGLSLSEAKSIIDTLEAAPYWFGVDTIREFSPRPAEREGPVAGGHVPEEPKSLGDTLEAAPHWFGWDTTREFNSPYVTCADGGHVAQAPKSLGDLLREKINDMKDEAPKEHSLWLNVYPLEPGYCRVATSRSRAEADWHASDGRIACINITFKEGEGL